MPTLNMLSSDLVPFADLGTEIEVLTSGFTIVRDGERLVIEMTEGGYRISNSVGACDSFATASDVLASAYFADIPRIAAHQALVLGKDRHEGHPVPIKSSIEGVVSCAADLGDEPTPWAMLDAWLRSQQATQNPESLDLLLVNGPAGVGKTTIVRETALRRAETYDGSAPLILQIASKGRVLQNIADLIAFMLQEFRTNITIAQLLSLVRHGLIVIAIDGFDELSDPNGFETAWSGLNSLIGASRGAATFILAGRETFVSTATMLRQLQSFQKNTDRLASLTLADPDPSSARHWLLQQKGWNADLLKREFVEPIFEAGSYALRPFFLTVLAREPEALKSDRPPASDLLSYLVDVMSRREAEKFVVALDPPNEREALNLYERYVVRFLEEVARDLAENQSESLSEDALDLLATVAADGLLPDDQVRAIVQRARTVVFLANDLRSGHVRFSHEQLLQHFLAREALRSVADGETPRYIRRNLFGREAIDVFGHVAREFSEDASRFLDAVRRTLLKPSRDRTNTNLAVLGVAAACGAPSEDLALKISDVGINEIFFPFTPPSGISFHDVAISILYAKGSDLSAISFDETVHVSTTEIDWATRLPSGMRNPQTLVHPGGVTTKQDEITSILHEGSGTLDQHAAAWPENYVDLIDRIQRYRAFWLRTNIHDTDPQGRKIVGHPDWPEMFDALKKLDLATIKSRPAAGVRAEFVHFRQDTPLLLQRDLFWELVQKPALEGSSN